MAKKYIRPVMGGRIGARVDEDVKEWLARKAIQSRTTISEVVRAILLQQFRTRRSA